MGRKAHKMKRMARNIIIAIIIVAVICGLVYSWQSRQQLDYRDCLEETAFTVDGQAVQMKWLGFYVVYEEREVEKQAQIYHADNTADYWNLHVDGHFIRQDAKDTIMQMAIHDYIYYQKAQAEGMTLDASKQRSLENTISDFWMDLLDDQVDNLPVTDEYIVETMQRIALAEKYQAALAAKKDRSYTSYSWNGGYYKKWLAKQDVEINDKIWDRVSVGNITLKHDKVNYVNGQDEKDSDENENRKK